LCRLVHDESVPRDGYRLVVPDEPDRERYAVRIEPTAESGWLCGVRDGGLRRGVRDSIRQARV